MPDQMVTNYGVRREYYFRLSELDCWIRLYSIIWFRVHVSQFSCFLKYKLHSRSMCLCFYFVSEIVGGWSPIVHNTQAFINKTQPSLSLFFLYFHSLFNIYKMLKENLRVLALSSFYIFILCYKILKDVKSESINYRYWAQNMQSLYVWWFEELVTFKILIYFFHC